MLAEDTKTIEELAQLSNTHAPSLYRMMRALASVGIFSETEEKQFELTPMAELLREGAMRSIALMFNSDWSDKTWGFFPESIKTGKTAFEKAHGLPVTEWLDRNPSAAEVFNEANAVRSVNSISAIIDAYDLSGINILMDIGGGLGVLMMEILKVYPSLKSVVADVPSVIKNTKELIKSRGLDKRCETIECDFFKNIPSGGDAYILSNILHDWPDDKCRIILDNCHEVMKPGSKLLIIEMIVPQGNQPSVAKLLDLEMMVTTGGRERTEDEFKDLLDNSGFKISQITQTNAGVCVIESLKK
jgi:hypothetical protein